MSMNIYLVEADGAFGNVLIPDDTEAEMMRERAGRRSSAPWTPPRGESDPADDFIPTDCVYSYTTLTMLLNHRGRDAVGELLEPCGEFLPVQLGRYDYAWFNCWMQLDAVDWERCEGEGRRNRPYGRFFKRVLRYELFADRLVGAPAMFRLGRAGLDLFCTDALHDAVRREGLSGFEFQSVWSSESNGIQLPPRGFDIIGTEAARLRGERDERARRDMLDRMVADGTIAASSFPSR